MIKIIKITEVEVEVLRLLNLNLKRVSKNQQVVKRSKEILHSPS